MIWRPADLPGIDTLVGPCVNNLPVCVTIDSQATPDSWLQAQQAQQREMALHQTMSLQDIQQQSQVPWRHRLFDSLVVFQNYRVDEDAQRIGRQVSCRLVSAPEASNSALCSRTR